MYIHHPRTRRRVNRRQLVYGPSTFDNFFVDDSATVTTENSGYGSTNAMDRCIAMREVIAKITIQKDCYAPSQAEVPREIHLKHAGANPLTFLLRECEGGCNTESDCSRTLKCFRNNDAANVPPKCLGTANYNENYCYALPLLKLSNYGNGHCGWPDLGCKMCCRWRTSHDQRV